MFSNLHPSLRRAFYAILGVFACLFIATYYTFKVALSAPNDIVDKDYYQVGLNYEKQIATQRKFKEEGYEVKIISNTGEFQVGKNLFQIQYLKGSIPLTGKEIYVFLERGATDRYNKKFLLKEESEGNYSTEIEFIESGEWILTVSAKETASDFQERQIVFAN